jgi:biotin/methionine sulfoxide reductase
MGQETPDFDAFWEAGEITLPQEDDDGGILRAFVEDPEGAPLPTRTGRIQLSSPTIAAFGYDDCPGHPAWMAPVDAPAAGRPPCAPPQAVGASGPERR